MNVPSVQEAKKFLFKFDYKITQLDVSTSRFAGFCVLMLRKHEQDLISIKNYVKTSFVTTLLDVSCNVCHSSVLVLNLVISRYDIMSQILETKEKNPFEPTLQAFAL